MAIESIVASLDGSAHETANQLLGVDLTVVICTHPGDNLRKDLEDFDDLVSWREFDGNPMHLGYMCHQVLGESLGGFDWYGYLEDDLEVSDPWWFRKLELFQSSFGSEALLQPHRYEILGGGPTKKIYIDGKLKNDPAKRFQNMHDTFQVSLDYLGEMICFQRTGNPHSGCFFLSNEQLEQWSRREYFLDRDGSFYSPLEGAATVGVMRTFRVYKPEKPQASFFELKHCGDHMSKRIISTRPMEFMASVPVFRGSGHNGNGRSAQNGKKTDSKPHVSSKAGLAFDYERDAFDVSIRRPMGRTVAGRQFLEAMIRHSSASSLGCLTSKDADFCHFSDLVSQMSRGVKRAQWVRHAMLQDLEEIGTLFHHSVGIGNRAWKRRAVGPTCYSIVGITHTICTERVMDAIGDLMIAPTQPWDALICTSSSVKLVIERVLNEWGDYLTQRIGQRPSCNVQLPVIPLGVDVARFTELRQSTTSRSEKRKEWGIGENDVVFLYLSRLSFHAKANPIPMLCALEAAAQRSSHRVWLLLVGRFSNAEAESVFRGVCNRHTSRLTVAYRDGSSSDNVDAAWQVADAFTLLSDNIQESFGLAPVEAMAAGLPVVVSDWDGFRDTVRHGVDGFLIPTTVPPPGSGDELVTSYFDQVTSYDNYVGSVSKSVAVDLGELQTAYESLIGNKELRLKMGAAAKMRASARFDWRIVIQQYEELFVSLAETRTSQTETHHCGRQPIPLRMDPFLSFQGHATHSMTESSLLLPTPKAEALVWLTDAVANFGPDPFCEQEVMNVIQGVGQGAKASQVLTNRPRGSSPGRVWRVIAWMCKFGLLRIVPSTAEDKGSAMECVEGLT